MIHPRITPGRVAASLCLGALGACALRSSSDAPELVMKPGARDRSFEFSYTARVPAVPDGAKRLDLWLPVPPSNESQEVELIGTDAPVKPEFHSEIEYGNRMAHFALQGGTLKPTSVTLTYRVHSVERLDDKDGSAFRDAPKDRFLAADALVPVDGEPRSIADSSVSGATDTLQKGERMYRTVLDRMRYSKDGEGWGRGDVAFACREGYGNCTDFHSLFISMARSQRIPARFIMGFPIPDERGAGEVKGYHCWAEFWVDGRGWVPVDASEADKHPDLADYYFGSLTENRVAFSMGRDIDLEPRQQGPRLNYFIYPYAELDGAPWNGIEKQFAFKDL